MAITTGYTENTNFARIYSDMLTGVWVGPVGTVLPVDLGAPLPAFKAAGWLGEDGISLDIEKDVTDFNALQGGSLIRRKVGKVGQKFTFVCLEEKALTLGIVFADQPIVVTGTGPTAIATQSIALDQAKTVTRALVVDAIDGDILDRYTIANADITFQGSINVANNELRAYTFEATILAGTAAFKITNSPGLVAVP